MGKSVDELMAMQFGGRSVAENIDHAVAAGILVAGADGTLALPAAQSSETWAKVPNGQPLGCQFLMFAMFRIAYAKTAVPHGCQTCFKVKVVFKTLRELVAGWGIAKTHPFTSKWGIDLGNVYSQAIYAGYYYVPGLDAARRHYWTVRDAYARDPMLGADIVITIKRGCSEYETAVGPSDAYTFIEDQADLEAHLKTRYRTVPRKGKPALPPLPLAHWIDFAFRSGDDTYLDFTGGQRLKPKTVSYDPGEPPVQVTD